MAFNEKMEIGKSGLKASRMGLGTWALGGGPAWSNRDDEEEAVRTVRECPRVGINLIDTAPGYNFGKSKEIIGAALKEMNRSDVLIITKCGITWEREGSLFNKVGDIQLYKNLSPESIGLELESSLTRLGVETIDVYMTHWQSVKPVFTPISETMQYLMELKAAGKIKAIGAANVTAEHVEEYLKYGQVDLVQGKYSILTREAERNILPICKQNNICFQAYSPLEQGVLAGFIAADFEAAPGTARFGKYWFQPQNLPKAVEMVGKWSELCEKYACTAAELAMNWIICQDENINLLTGAGSQKEVIENAHALSFRIEAYDIEKMREWAEEAGALT